MSVRPDGSRLGMALDLLAEGELVDTSALTPEERPLLALAQALRLPEKDLQEQQVTRIRERIEAAAPLAVETHPVVRALRGFPPVRLSNEQIDRIAQKFHDGVEKNIDIPSVPSNVKHLPRRDGKGRLLPGVALLPSLRDLKARLTAFSGRVRKVVDLVPSSNIALNHAAETMAALAMVMVVIQAASPTATTDTRSTQVPATSAQAALDSESTAGSASPADAVRSAVRGSGAPTILPSADSQPEDAALVEITASPSYSSSPTLYASGTLSRGCGGPSCPVLFRSSDGGATWAQLPATGFAGGSIFLPPNYPEDSRIFASTPRGLQVSLDSGDTFLTLSPVAGPAAISPAFSRGDPRILIGSSPAFEWRDDLKTARPLESQILGSSAINFAFSPSYPEDHRILAGATSVSQNTLHQSGVFLCEGISGCRRLSWLEGARGVPRLHLSPAFSQDDTIFALVGRRLYLSTNAGSGFSVLPAPRGLTSVTLDPNFGPGRPTVYAATLRDGEQPGGVWRSLDSGRTWQQLFSGDQLSGVTDLAVTPSGRILALVAAGDGGTGGFLCSVDGGRGWASRCVAETT